MKNVKQIGVCMDHSTAFLLELINGEIIQNIINSDFTYADKLNALSKNENLMHNKENAQVSDFYKQISLFIKDFNEVVLFGPTNAKMELFNLLKDDHRFDTIKIETKTTDKMREDQQCIFVKDYFKND